MQPSTPSANHSYLQGLIDEANDIAGKDPHNGDERGLVSIPKGIWEINRGLDIGSAVSLKGPGTLEASDDFENDALLYLVGDWGGYTQCQATYLSDLVLRGPKNVSAGDYLYAIRTKVHPNSTKGVKLIDCHFEKLSILGLNGFNFENADRCYNCSIDKLRTRGFNGQILKGSWNHSRVGPNIRRSGAGKEGNSLPIWDIYNAWNSSFKFGIQEGGFALSSNKYVCAQFTECESCDIGDFHYEDTEYFQPNDNWPQYEWQGVPQDTIVKARFIRCRDLDIPKFRVTRPPKKHATSENAAFVAQLLQFEDCKNVNLQRLRYAGSPIQVQFKYTGTWDKINQMDSMVTFDWVQQKYDIRRLFPFQSAIAGRHQTLNDLFVSYPQPH